MKWHKSAAPDTGATGEEGLRDTNAPHYIFYLTVMEECNIKKWGESG
jgi:hypothetical protein